MKQRATKLILVGMASLTVGIGATSVRPAISSHDHVASISNPDKAAVTGLTKRAQIVAMMRYAEPWTEKATERATEKATERATGTKRERATQNANAGVRARRAKARGAKARRARARHAHGGRNILLSGQTRGSYFWDTGSSGNGDTGAPASGQPMREGCFASPSWPMGTEGYVTYQGKRADFVICDRGPGAPSNSGVMLDIDGKTYAGLTGGQWSEPEVVGGDGQAGNIPVHYHVTKWGHGSGQGEPEAY